MTAPQQSADTLHAELFVLQVCEFLDVGDGVYRFHSPSRYLSRLPGVVVMDIDLHHRLLPPLAEAADVLILAGFEADMFPVLERRRAGGRITIFEANDYYYDIQPWNPLSAEWFNRALQDSFAQGLAVADAVQTSMPELARRWRERIAHPVIAFPNQLTDVPPLAPPPVRPLTIGWGGSPGHFADWYHIAPLLEKWLIAHPHVHLEVMNHEFAKPFVQLPAERYRFTPFGSLADYLRFVHGLDIGLAPLLPSGYNRCRSDVKFLEYASHGVAGIYADLEPYQHTVVHGETGLLYKTEAELMHYLDLLAEDATLRGRIREQAHAYVAAQRRLENHIGDRLAFYRQLLPGPPHGCAIPAEVLTAAVREERYLQLRRQQPEQTLMAAMKAQTSRESVQTLTRLVEQCPNYVAALQHLGKQLNDQRDSKAALRYLEQARTLNPHSARTLCEMGRAYYLLNDDARARKTMENALTINPYYQSGWQYLLRALAIARAADGRPWAERAHQIHPANFALALLGVKVYPPAEGVAVLRQLLDEYAPTFMADEVPAAAAAFSETIRDVAGPLLGTRSVLELLRRACAVFPASASLANMLARALHLAGHYAESHAEYVRALDLKRAAQTFRAEFPQEDGTFYFGQFAEHIRSLTGGGNGP
jgi:tetratricopeptide (TPR) repeat protein